jgi:hypothetical protein
MITQNELIGISAWNKLKLHTVLSGKQFPACMTFRRNIQIALAEYSKNNKTLDVVQMGAIQICSWIEKWCRDAYYKMRLEELLRQRADLALKPKKFAKNIIRQEWAAMAARWGY